MAISRPSATWSLRGWPSLTWRGSIRETLPAEPDRTCSCPARRPELCDRRRRYQHDRTEGLPRAYGDFGVRPRSGWLS